MTPWILLGILSFLMLSFALFFASLWPFSKFKWTRERAPHWTNFLLISPFVFVSLQLFFMASYYDTEAPVLGTLVATGFLLFLMFVLHAVIRLPKFRRALWFVFGLVPFGFLQLSFWMPKPFARYDQTRIGFMVIAQELQRFKLDTGQYPTTEQGLKALLAKPDHLESWRGPYVNGDDKLLDVWGNPLIYESDGRTLKLTTVGPDGLLGTKDDVSYPSVYGDTK